MAIVVLKQNRSKEVVTLQCALYTRQKEEHPSAVLHSNFYRQKTEQGSTHVSCQGHISSTQSYKNQQCALLAKLLILQCCQNINFEKKCVCTVTYVNDTQAGTCDMLF